MSYQEAYDLVDKVFATIINEGTYTVPLGGMEAFKQMVEVVEPCVKEKIVPNEA